MPSPPFDLILVRHGLTDWNEEGRLLGWSEIGLNERGRAQAAAAAEALRSFAVRMVLQSPQPRARQTAEPIARAHGLEAAVEPGLAEVWLGRWQGKTFAEIRDDPDLRRYIADPTHECEAIESAPRVERRVVEVAHRIEREGRDGAVVLVSHGDPLRIVIADFLGMELAAYRRLQVGNGSISVLRFGRQRRQLVALNWLPGGPPAA